MRAGGLGGRGWFLAPGHPVDEHEAEIAVLPCFHHTVDLIEEGACDQGERVRG